MKKSFKSYIDRVVRDAFAAENRPYRGHEVIYAITPNGQKFLFIFGPQKYGRVRRRIEYRLERNLTKHFPQFEGYEILACSGSGIPGIKYFYIDDDGNPTERITSLASISMRMQANNDKDTNHC